MSLDLSPFEFNLPPAGSPPAGVAVLLVHGFTGSPPEMRGLGEFLASNGLAVLGVRLAGHGTTPEDMARTGRRDWVASAEMGLQRLQAQSRQVFVAGLSMGGLLTLHLAARYPLSGAVVMSTPTHIDGDWRIPLLPVLKHFVHWHTPNDPPDLSDLTALERIWTYPRIPIRCIDELFQLSRRVRRELPKIRVPLLIMHGRRDRAVPLTSAQEIYDTVGSADKTLVWLEHSGHCITEDIERQAVWQHAYQFIVSGSH